MGRSNSLRHTATASAWYGTRATFGAAHFAKSLVWSLTDLVFSYQANAVMGLSAAATGFLLTGTMLYSGTLDPVIAWTLRAAEGRPEKTLNIQRAGGIATALLLMLLFYPLSAAPGARLTYLAIVATFFRTAYAVYDVTQNALTSLLPCNSADAAAYVTVRMMMGAAARLCIAASAALFIGDIAGTVSHAAFVTVPVALMVILTTVQLGRVRPPGPVPTTGVVCATVATGMTRPLLAAIAHIAGLSLLSRFLLFVTGSVAGHNAGSILLLSFVAGTVVGPFIAAWLGRWIGREQIGTIFVSATVIGAVSLTLTPHASSAALAALLYGIGTGGSGALIWTAVSEAIRRHADQTGVRTDLLSFATLTTTIKFSLAAAGMVFGFLLDGFKAGDSASLGVIIGITVLGGVVFIVAIRGARPIDYLLEREINHTLMSGAARSRLS